MLLQHKILGALLGAHFGLERSGGASVGWQFALQTLERLAREPTRLARDMSQPFPAVVRDAEPAESILAVVPNILLEFAEFPDFSIGYAMRAIARWTGGNPQAGDDPARGVLATIALLQSPFPVTISRDFRALAAGPSSAIAPRALAHFCAAPHDYRSCLERAARHPQITAATLALTGAFLGAYQGSGGIPLSWQRDLTRDGTWAQYERLTTVVMAAWAGRRSAIADRPPTALAIGPAGSLQARRGLQMPSWR